MREKKGSEYLLGQYINKSKSGGYFFTAVEMKRYVFHRTNSSRELLFPPGSQRCECVRQVRSAKELNDYFLMLMSITRAEGSACGA